MIKSFRRFLCRWFSLHKTFVLHADPKSAWDILECKHCGAHFHMHWHTRETRPFSWR